jgi:hypothetical protein
MSTHIAAAAIAGGLIACSPVFSAEGSHGSLPKLLANGWRVVSANPAGRMKFNAIEADGKIVDSASPAIGHYIYLQKDDAIAFCVSALDKSLVDSCRIYGGGNLQ